MILQIGLMNYLGIRLAELWVEQFTPALWEVCVFLAPVFSAFTAVATYLLTKELKNPSAGLFAAAFIGIAPGYISRSVAGSYDNEGIAIFLLVFTFYLWIKALKVGSAFYGTLAALFYFYMVSAWGGYVFIINLIPLHAFCLILMGRFSTRLYISYSTFYVTGTLASMTIPFVGFQPLRTSEHMAAFGVFGLLQILAFCEMLRSHLSANEFKSLFQVFIITVAVGGLAAIVGLTYAGLIAPFTGRFYSLWDTGYAKIHIPIIASVSEHQPTAWPSFFFDLQLLVAVFPAGLYFCFKELKDEHVFVLVYGLFASYFAGVMVRLMLTLTPIVCVAAAIAFTTLFDTYFADNSAIAVNEDEIGKEETKDKETDTKTPSKKGKKEEKKPAKEKEVPYGLKISSLRLVIVIPFFVVLAMFAWHCTYVTSSAYSSPSVVLASTNRDGSMHIIDDFREAYFWLRQNTDEKAKIASWWDYGYQITGMSNRTTLVDNNTWNNTHIATVGKIMSCSEEVSYEVMQKLDVDYLLVIFGGLIGYSGDDINKFLWMIRIGEGVFPNDISERKFFNERGEYAVGATATKTMKESLMYKMTYYRFAELFGGRGARDNVRGQEIPSTPIKLSTIEEAYTTENMIVRIYQVKKPDNIGRPLSVASSFGKKRKRKANLHTRWNSPIVNLLVEGARNTLLESGVSPENIVLHNVPGAYELPFATQKLLKKSANSSQPFDAAISIGVLIKGSTMHFEYIADATSQGLMRVGLDLGIPVVFGVLTCLTEEQAFVRAGDASKGSNAHNHGIDWAHTAIEMATLG
ncbi:oligosaccharyl transferase stt3 subunit [Boothiomyces sp. JEL0866]|nr:oligosaccharyl transferase stt3 subunit [Boothiomyces sp. JEL0866]